MNSTIQTCDQHRLESFLRGESSAEAERELTVHLDECLHCRNQLEHLAAEPSSWDEAEVLLKSRALDRKVAGGRQSRQPLQIQNVLDALGPTDDPAMLGRLGAYEVSGVVGAGAMGVVLKALDRSLDRIIAIKVLAPYLASSGAARRRFAREAKAAAAVLHPNVIAIHSVSNDESLPYLVMPYVRGASLQRRLDNEGPLPVGEILRIASQIAAGLTAAHAQGLVHRDIKPANILLEEGVERVTITDFGLARAVDDSTMTRTGVIAGTPQFMSPEQARGETIDQRSDLFSLGSVLYTMCAGRSPFRAETSYGVMRRITDQEPRPIREINPEIPEWLCQVIAKLMAKQPADRFASASEVAKVLEACLAHVQQPTLVPLPECCHSLHASAGSVTEQKTARSSLRPGVITMIAAIGLSLLGVVFWQATEPTDISGRWSGDEWGEVTLKETEPGHYEGTYSDTFGAETGELKLEWSRIERRFNGTWGEENRRFGRISVRLRGADIHGAWTTSGEASISPGRPELGDLLWTRAVPVKPQSITPEFLESRPSTRGSESAATSHVSDAELDGTWKVERTLHDGKEIPLPANYEHYWKFVTTTGRLTTAWSDDAGELHSNTNRFTHNRATTPKQLTTYGERILLQAIYEIHGDTLRICIFGRAELERPSSFEAKSQKAAGTLMVYELKRRVTTQDGEKSSASENEVQSADHANVVKPGLDRSNARSVVEAYVAAALAEDGAAAMELAKSSAGTLEDISEFAKTLKRNQLAIKWVYVGRTEVESAAMAVSEKVKLPPPVAPWQADGQYVFTLIKINDTWYVVDTDFQAGDRVDEEISKFLRHQPNSIVLPPLPDELPPESADDSTAQQPAALPDVTHQSLQIPPPIAFYLAEFEPAAELMEHTVPGSNQKVYVAKQPIVTILDIASAQVILASDGHPSITMEFRPASTTLISDVTKRHLNKPLAILVDGKLLSAPTIREPFSSKAMITGSFSREEAERIVKAITRSIEALNALAVSNVDAEPIWGEPVNGLQLALVGISDDMHFKSKTIIRFGLQVRNAGTETIRVRYYTSKTGNWIGPRIETADGEHVFINQMAFRGGHNESVETLEPNAFALIQTPGILVLGTLQTAGGWWPRIEKPEPGNYRLTAGFPLELIDPDGKRIGKSIPMISGSVNFHIDEQ